MRDELDEAAERGKPGKDASKEAVEEEEQTGGASGGVKDNVYGRWDELRAIAVVFGSLSEPP